MEVWNLMAGGAVLGVIAGSWERIKAAVWRCFNLFIQDITVDDEEIKDALINYLVGRFDRVGMYDRKYESMYDYINTERRYGYVAFEKFGDQSILFRQGWRPMYFQAHPAQKSEAGTPGTPARRSLLFFRGTFDVDALVADALRIYNELNWKSDGEIDGEEKGEVVGRGDCKPRRFFLRHIPDFHAEKSKHQPDSSTWQYYHSNRVVGRGLDEIGLRPEPGVRMLDRLFFPAEVLAMIAEVQIWSRSREVYADLGIPWKRGWLLHGPGGTGKSAVASAFAHDLDMPIFIFNLSELSNMEFMESWRAMLTHTPCIALIEDIDNVFHARQNVAAQSMSFGRMFGRAGRKGDDEEERNSESKEVERRFGNPLSFDVLLNCLDGVERCEGLFTIITTNHLDQIDPALGQPVTRTDGTADFISTRPGRIDKAIELTYMRPEVKERMAHHLLRRFPTLRDDFLATLGTEDRRETPAQFQERCGQLALREYWRAQEGKLNPGAIATEVEPDPWPEASHGWNTVDHGSEHNHKTRVSTPQELPVWV